MISQFAHASPITSGQGDVGGNDKYLMLACQVIAQAARDRAACFFEPGGGYDFWLQYLWVCGVVPYGQRPIPTRILKSKGGDA